MSKLAISIIAMAIMAVAIAVLVADPSPRGQNTMMLIGFLASAFVIAAGVMGAGSSDSDAARNVHQETHIHNHPAAAPQPMAQPIHYQQPPAQPQVIYMPMPQPYYPPAPAYALPPQYAAPAGHLAAPPHHQAPAMQYHPAPAIEHHQAQYRGAIDVVAEPVYHAPQQQRIARGAVPQLESPQSAGLIRRMARRAVG